jgi:hypothetical protein
MEGGDGFAEAAFDGVYAAIEKTKWREGSNRAILLISDAPSHDLGEYNPQHLTAEVLVQEAAAKGVRIHALLLGDPKIRGILKMLSRARDQYEALASGVNHSMAGQFTGIDSYEVGSYRDAVADIVMKWVREIKERQRGYF